MTTDVLIIGSGGAGLSAALSAKEQGADVIVACKSLPNNAQTCMAQGGINASFDINEIDTHISDTLRSSHGLGSEQMTRTMCENSAIAIEWLASIGVPFSLDEKDNLAKRFMGGASQKRTYYAQDYTGLKILHTLYDNCLKNGVIFKNERLLLNLIVQDKTVQGATFLDITTGEIEAIYAKSVVIATGGYSTVYHGFTTNGIGSTGDGIASIIRAGGVASDLEFVQFHPTALKKSSILVSEAARGEGGYLVNSEGERFVNELAPRDEVARAITREINNGKGVFLDLRHLRREKLTELLPQEMKLCRLHEGIDMATELIPIKPAAHYTMGGIEVNDSLETRDIKGCFAVGECSNAHVHGANRLGGNSLLEIIALGRMAGINASKFEPKTTAKNQEQLLKDKHFISGVYNFTNQINFYEKREFLGKILYHNAGVIRNEIGLKGVLAAVRQMQKEFTFMGISDKSKDNNTNLVEFIEFGNTLEVVEMLLVGALHRTESRGAHYREDFNSENETFRSHSMFWKEDGVLCASFEEAK
ncbi:MAG: FAD-dependent oxidoreductase [Sulfurovaceae bacterium]|nr:FAD-dependent oxidoreductase [Sulfurovaceae bacterium]